MAILPKLLNGDGVGTVWGRIFSLVETVTGDVDVSGKGTLQEQIEKLEANDSKINENLANHTHKYAGSSSVGGSAASAVKLDTATAGSETQPCYFTGGKPVACGYTVGKSVPADAKFTDTTYGAMTGATTSAAGKAGLVPAPTAGAATRYLRSDGTWQVPPNSKPTFMTKKFYAASQITIGAYAATTLALSTPSGYTFACILGAWSVGQIVILNIDRDASNESVCKVWNPSGQAVTTGWGCEVLYYKNS